MGRARCAFLAVMLCVLVRDSVAEDIKAALLTRYAPKSEQLERFYTHCRLSAVVLSDSRPHRTNSKPRVAFSACGDLMRIDSYRGADDSRPGWRTVLATPTESAYLFRRLDEREFSVVNIDVPYAKTQTDVRLSWPVPFAPYCLFADRLVDVIGDPGLAVMEVTEPMEDGGEHTITVLFEREYLRDGALIRHDGRFEFLADGSWALRRYWIGAGSRYHCGEMTYTPGGSLPVLSDARFWEERDGETVDVREMKVTEFIASEIPQSEFKMAALGVQPVGSATGGRAPRWPWAVGTGVLMVACARLLLRRTADGRR